MTPRRIAPGAVTPADIAAKLREITGDVTERAEEARGSLVSAAGAAAVVLFVLTYLLGRRRGRRRSTVVEIRRG